MRLTLRVKVVGLPNNTGFVGGIAAGVATAMGKYVVFLNNDMRVKPDWLEAFDEAFDGGRIQCASGLILSWDGQKTDFVEGILTFDGHALQRHQGATPLAEYLQPRDAFIACGGNMAVERNIFLELGGFDTDFFAYTEDVDFSWRLNAAGYHIRFAPAALAYHHHQGTSTSLGVYRRGFLYERNAFLTLYKNADAPDLESLLHLAWVTLIHRSREIIAHSIPGSGLFGIDPSYLMMQNAHKSPSRLAESVNPRDFRGRVFGKIKAVSRYHRVHGYRETLARIFHQLGHHFGTPVAIDTTEAGIIDFSHPHVVSQLQSIWYLMGNLDRMKAKREAAQKTRKRADRILFEEFNPWVVATYPGDETLFSSEYFREHLPRDIPYRFATLGEIHG